MNIDNIREVLKNLPTEARVALMDALLGIQAEENKAMAAANDAATSRYHEGRYDLALEVMAAIADV